MRKRVLWAWLGVLVVAVSSWAPFQWELYHDGRLIASFQKELDRYNEFFKTTYGWKPFSTGVSVKEFQLQCQGFVIPRNLLEEAANKLCRTYPGTSQPYDWDDYVQVRDRAVERAGLKQVPPLKPFLEAGQALAQAKQRDLNRWATVGFGVWLGLGVVITGVFGGSARLSKTRSNV